MAIEVRSVEDTLALWVSGLLTADQVVEWAANELARHDEPPSALIDLICDGPERCLKRAEYDFPPRPTKLSYVQEFSLRALAVTLTSDFSVLEFANWAARRCMGENLTDESVTFGYQLDHLLNDCQDTVAAKTLVRNGLPLLLPNCRAIAAPFIES